MDVISLKDFEKNGTRVSYTGIGSHDMPIVH